MDKLKRIILVLLAVPMLLFFFNVQSAYAVDNSALIAQLQQEIQSLMQQIIALLQQQLQTKNVVNTYSNSKTATLTVSATGVTAYVSINNGAQFTYSSPVTLNNGDAYSVIASASSGGANSNSKCSGTASSGGSYVCNIKINQ